MLEARQQAILFLNRRGTATYVFCRDCGSSLACPRCDLPLTFHSPQAALLCHYCGYQRPMPATCPTCGSDQIRQFGTGTERVEERGPAASSRRRAPCAGTPRPPARRAPTRSSWRTSPPTAPIS